VGVHRAAPAKRTRDRCVSKGVTAVPFAEQASRAVREVRLRSTAHPPAASVPIGVGRC
jgi:hypothetical protein